MPRPPLPSGTSPRPTALRRPALGPLTAAALAMAGSVAFADDDVQPHGGMLRYPDVGASQIVFAYANDLWVVDRGGGSAVPLASPPGGEMFPRFSADGKSIAFMGNYDGNRDLYTIPVQGGLPVRATHHPTTEVLCDWTPAGTLLFFAPGINGIPAVPQIFTVDPQGGLPQRVPVPYGAAAAISPDGKWLAYTPHTADHRTWKRYRGGMATDIWLYNLESHESRKITDWEGTDTQPMWQDRTLYYLSDAGREARLNIWAYQLDSQRREQITNFEELDVKWPSIGPGPGGRGEIIFQLGSELHLLDLAPATKRSKAVKVTIPGARPTIRTQQVNASEFSRWWHISPSGKRALAEARGDIWTLPAEKGSPRNLTRTSGAAEREASWSPDGRWIAYFSDGSGEYELCITQSDGKGETKQLTTGSQTYYYDPHWSPDSKHILFQNKAGRMLLHTLEPPATIEIDRDPWGQRQRPSWSHDSRWIAYSRTVDETPTTSIWLYEMESGARHRVTSGVFPDGWPAFDRKGDYLYFASGRSFTPTYSDMDTTWIYTNSQVLIAAPLRKDVKSPWLPKSDEEEWKKDEDKKGDDEADEEGKGGEDEEEAKDDAGGDKKDEDAEDDKQEDQKQDEDKAPAKDDGVSGTWDGTVSGGELPPGLEFSMTLWLKEDGSLTGSIAIPMGTAELKGTYDRATGEMQGTLTTSDGEKLDFTGRISDGALTMSVSRQGMVIELEGTRTAAATDEAAGEDKAGKKDKPAEKVAIDLEGLEGRAFQLPVPPGQLINLAVNDKNQLLYSRLSSVEGELASIMLFDLEDEEKAEKSVAKGATGFEVSADGKKIITLREGGASIQNAAAGATGKPVPTAGMMAHIDPRQEWRQLLVESWRLQRDFFYVENMHGVDWPAMRYRYEKMLEDCVTREDVSYVIREMISELNIGHAYYFGGDVEDQPSVPVGMLGVDWELHEGAYRIARIYEGAPWDVDARGPLGRGVDVKEGEYVLAVNGVPIDTSRDPWAAFVALTGRPITLTVSEKPAMDESARDVVVQPVDGEHNLRYRAWIEKNRTYVQEKTGGRVGYIYVPNTGTDGQTDLYRQFVGQFHKPALIIDERWNGGGQIPTRFIELLNRPVTNYWARRDARDWKWPPDAHHGPKCMLINGLAGSGGDMFPWLFRQAGLGKLIGTRTWGGLVGISGNPDLIDGAIVTVPTFGFYETDGTWGVEGHGVDPDIQVLDDPALMAGGADPQLDTAIRLMLEELQRAPYTPPQRPAAPNRAGMGIEERDK